MSLHWHLLFLMIAPLARRELAAMILRADLQALAHAFGGGDGLDGPLAMEDSIWADAELLRFEAAARACAPRLAALLPRRVGPPVRASEVVARVAPLLRVFGARREAPRPTSAPRPLPQAAATSRAGSSGPASAFGPRGPPESRSPVSNPP